MRACFGLCGLVFLMSALSCDAGVEDEGADDFFSVRSVVFHGKAPAKGVWPYKELRRTAKGVDREFLPFLEVVVRARQQVASLDVRAKAYFYNKGNELISTLESPTPVDRDGALSGAPVFFPGGKDVVLCYAVPEAVLKTQGWRAVLVFGDGDGVAAKVYTKGESVKPGSFVFPERELLGKSAGVRREKAEDPLVEQVVKPNVPGYPKITLFLRRPLGAADFSEAKGVLALCLLGDSIADVKRRLQEADVKDELSGVLRFAEERKLAVLCWGAHRFWKPTANWDQMSRTDAAKIDRDSDEVARAWAQGVDALVKKHGIPRKNFLLWGFSGSAQYAARLALRQPGYFLAVRIHAPSSFDKPTPEAGKLLWCLSTGEEECGYERSLRFLEACRLQNYPIIYKAFPNMGHANHPLADKLGLDFFDYALTLADAREKADAAQKSPKTAVVVDAKKAEAVYEPWPDSFRNPDFLGDVFRQSVCNGGQIPAQPGLRIPLPTQKLADAWGTEVE